MEPTLSSVECFCWGLLRVPVQKMLQEAFLPPMFGVLVDTRYVTNLGTDAPEAETVRGSFVELAWKFFDKNRSTFSTAPIEYTMPLHDSSDEDVPIVLMLLNPDVVSDSAKAARALKRLASSRPRLQTAWNALCNAFPNVVKIVSFPCTHLEGMKCFFQATSTTPFSRVKEMRACAAGTAGTTPVALALAPALGPAAPALGPPAAPAVAPALGPAPTPSSGSEQTISETSKMTAAIAIDVGALKEAIAYITGKVEPLSDDIRAMRKAYSNLSIVPTSTSASAVDASTSEE